MAVRAVGVGGDDFRSGFHIGAVNILNHIRSGQAKIFIGCVNEEVAFIELPFQSRRQI